MQRREIMICTYTIKKDPNTGIVLLNEQNEQVIVTDILNKCKGKYVFAFEGKKVLICEVE